MPDFRKETPASITYAGYDRANPLPYVVNASGTARGSANLFSQSYSNFNAGTSNTPQSWFGAYGDSDFSSSNSTPITSSRIGTSLQQISGAHDQIYFKLTDNRAGIATGSITLEVDVFNATNTVSGSYETSLGVIDDTYIFSGTDLNLFDFAGSADYPDYTGNVNLSAG